MAGVNEVNMNPEQRQIEAAGQASRESDFASKLVDSLDLPASLAANMEEANDRALKGEPEEVEEEKEEESEQTEPEKTEDKNEEDEDLVPKSKMQKRIDEITAERKKLEARLAKLEREKEEAKPKEDDDLRQLESKSEDELRSLKRQVRILQAKNSQDDQKLGELVDLEEKIDRTMASAPQRFQGSQILRFQEAVRESSAEIEDFDKVANDIGEYAKNIFQKSPSLQKSVMGQADAWNLAVEHYKELSKISAGKSKETELKRELNTLKKKVSVDVGTQKKASEETNEEKLYRKAKYGGSRDKEEFIKSKINVNQLVDSEFLQRYQ